jgi:hypothetical protein
MLPKCEYGMAGAILPFLKSQAENILILALQNERAWDFAATFQAPFLSCSLSLFIVPDIVLFFNSWTALPLSAVPDD